MIIFSDTGIRKDKRSFKKGDFNMQFLIFLYGLVPVFILVITGWLIRYKKVYWLISGYNTMSSEKKKNVDIEGLGRFISNVCFVISAIILGASVFMAMGNAAVSGIIFALLVPVIIYTLINAQKYDGNTRNKDGKMKTGTKVLIGSIISVFILASLGVCVLLYFSSRPVEYNLQNGILSIKGAYGQEVPVSEISSLELKQTLPEILLRTNGSSLGNMHKGYFKLKDIGQVKLFLDASKPPFIYIKAGSETIILNRDDSDKTKILYEKLLQEWESQ